MSSCSKTSGLRRISLLQPVVVIETGRQVQSPLHGLDHFLRFPDAEIRLGQQHRGEGLVVIVVLLVETGAALRPFRPTRRFSLRQGRRGKHAAEPCLCFCRSVAFARRDEVFQQAAGLGRVAADR